MRMVDYLAGSALAHNTPGGHVSGNNLGPCSEVVGAVTVNVVWITRNDKNQMNEIPRLMRSIDKGDWPATANPPVPVDAGRPLRWNYWGSERSVLEFVCEPFRPGGCPE